MRDRSNLTFKFTGEAHILEDGKFFTRFKSPRGNTVFYDGDNDIFIDKYTLLESMSACESRENLYEIEKLLCTLFSCDFDSSFSRMYSYVMGSKLEEFRHHEFYYQDEFKKKCESLGFGSIVEHKNIKGHIPDAWVNKNGELIPVEVKVDKFNASALKQLSRYMFRNLHDKCSNDDVLCDIMLDLCKNNASSIAIVWELFHDTLIKRLLERHNGMVHSLVQDENGDIEYDGKRFKDVLVDMNSKEDADDCIE